MGHLWRERALCFVSDPGGVVKDHLHVCVCE